MTHPVLDAALEQLWRQSRFTSYFFQSIHCVQEDAIPTLALTVSRARGTLLYNGSFLERLTRDELIGLLAHEMLHVVLAHSHRAYPDEDLILQNLAQDMVVNSYLRQRCRSFFSRQGDYAASVPRLILPAGLPGVPEAFQRETHIEDPSWEDLYFWLGKQSGETLHACLDQDSAAINLERTASAGPPGFLGNPLSVRAEDLPGMEFSLGDLKGLAFCNREDEIVPTGVHLFHGRREINGLEGLRDRVLTLASADPECRQERSWQEIRGIIQAAAGVDISSWRHRLRSLIDYSSQSKEWVYTYGRLNRRYSSGGLYPPGRRFREQELITVAVDVSASMVMRPEQIEAAFGVIEELLGKYSVHLVCIDESLFVPVREGDHWAAGSDPRVPCRYRKGDWRRLKTGSSGTTLFAPLFNDYLRGHHELLLVVTDGEIYDLGAIRRYTPTVWVVPSDRREPFDPPFGQVVTIGGGQGT